MYGDLLLDRLGVKFLGPAPLHLELWHMLSIFHWNALGSTLGWWFCLLGRRLGRRKQIFGNPFPFGNVPCKIQLVPKTVSHTLYTTGTLHPHNLRVRIQVTIIIRHICPVPGGNMVVLSSSISAKVSKMSRHECKGYKWQCPTTQSPTQQHNEPQRKILGWPSDGPPPPPLGNDKGWGTTRGGGTSGSSQDNKSQGKAEQNNLCCV